MAEQDWLPEPMVEDSADDGPEHQAVLADSVGMALLVVLENLSPAERLSFVLHDVFAVPFDEVAHIMDRTPDSARQLASRARRRVQAAPQPIVTSPGSAGCGCLPGPPRGAATSRRCWRCSIPTWSSGWISGRAAGSPTGRLPGANPVARQVLATAPRFVHLAQPVLVNGEAGALFGTREETVAVIGFTIGGRPHRRAEPDSRPGQAAAADDPALNPLCCGPVPGSPGRRGADVPQVRVGFPCHVPGAALVLVMNRPEDPAINGGLRCPQHQAGTPPPSSQPHTAGPLPQQVQWHRPALPGMPFASGHAPEG